LLNKYTIKIKLRNGFYGDIFKENYGDIFKENIVKYGKLWRFALTK